MIPSTRSRMLRAFGIGVWLLSLCWSALLHAQPPLPALTGRVTDLTGTLKPTERQQLDAQLADLERRKGSQLVVVMVASTQPEPISDYAIRLAERWKIGRAQEQGKKVDDGVILLVAKDDRKVRIEVGYGLEGAIPDGLAKRIIVEAIAPKFREGNYFGGIQAAVTDLTKLIDGEPLPQPWRDAQKPVDASGADEGVGWLGMLLFVFVGGLIATTLFGRFFGSLAGAVGAGALTTISGFALPFALLAALGAFLFLLVFSASRSGLSRVGRHTYRPGGVILPGGWGGGGWGGGGGGGGGGGFSGGGGGFGGGGASGDW